MSLPEAYYPPFLYYFIRGLLLMTLCQANAIGAPEIKKPRCELAVWLVRLCAKAGFRKEREK